MANRAKPMGISKASDLLITLPEQDTATRWQIDIVISGVYKARLLCKSGGGKTQATDTQ